MPLASPVFQDATTINYSLEWPHLENPSNTTFAGPTQIDICHCGNNTDSGHIYTRYRCSDPVVSFASPEDELWVLQTPLGQINLLRPATNEELQRRREVGEGVKPSAYAGKNFLLLSGPCPRGRYQAHATLQYLRSLSPDARQRVENLTVLIQPYEEDCRDDQGGRAYMALARYIIAELPAFKSLHVNIWGEATRTASREFVILLRGEGISIKLNWDWWGESVEEYADADAFLEAIDIGVVVQRSMRATAGGGSGDTHEEGAGDNIPHQQESLEKEDCTNPNDSGVDNTTTPTLEQENSDDDWSDETWTPLSPLSPAGAGGNEDSGWQVL
ncbi:hypothetical protein HBI23_176380 [Parastagonospora nodorum]|nr:hypothetical protein HBH49_164510 [Parastagonospora nodorum]KAH4119208.1 hypothetical protein HBH47_126670 [Parastagonospora nodorum]KAH4180998.1 hypothetical protein HBH43_011950 [Parastagonospora nodorum]KAH4193547.1 hypothetical protein HBH42_101980 [Parastagonospora nodorum]KAH4808867.1 hypothetical protein HBH61_115690 [Parastagonospora nodorum]